MDDQTPIIEEEEELSSSVSADATDVINIEDEMKNSYIEYAMSVIVGRALPDVRDGLKPVHRRILYAMYDAGYVAGKPYKKCARIVGDVLGRYHPHGDTAVYDALVRLAQDFSLRYPLIDGQGNYGSVDGDNAAAMRYTEARMTRIAMSLLDDIEKDTVSFVPNFDESLKEPTVLPTRLPTLLLNGSSGIAVGMATNIPPHNLRELVDGIALLIDNPDATVDDLMVHIKGPDFPTYGIICGTEGIRQAYATGRGSILIRARTSIEESKKRGKTAIIVHEIPYQVNKANLIIRIAELVQEKKITDITDLRDESDRKGMRIYIELKRDANPDVVLNQLFKHTALQNTFGVNMVAIVAGIPRTLTLKEVLVHYIEHRHEVIVRRTQYDLRKAQERLHLLEGFRIALDSIDAVIALIKASMSTEEARHGLMETFGLTEIQATAILEMRLQRLTGLERDKLEKEYNEILLKISDFQDILSNEPRIYRIIKEEHQELADKYGDARRSQIGGAVDAMNLEDLIPEESVAVLISQRGFVKRMPLSMFRNQQRGGRGVNSMTTRDEDQIAHLVVTSSHDYLLCFTNVGRVYKIRVFNIPEASKQSKGVSIAHFLSFEDGEYVTACIPIDNFESDEYLLMATQRGVVKKTEIKAYSHFKNKPIIALTIDEGDQLKWVRRTNSKKDVVMVTANGMVIRFGEDDVRPMGRVSRGVRGINIKKEDTLISMDVIDTEETNMHLLIITRFGYGKNIKVGDFKDQRRGGIGVRCLKFRKTVAGDHVTDAIIATKDQDMVAVTKSGTMCRQAIGSISVQKRESQGVRIVKLDPKDEIIAMSALDEEVDEVIVATDNA